MGDPPFVPANARREFFDLLLHHGAIFYTPDENGETPLHFAASAGNAACIEWLIEQGADVRALDIDHHTPLHAAAYEGNRRSVELLVQHGAAAHLADSKGWLPLHFAAIRGQSVDAAGVLVQNGSDVMAVDKKGRKVLHLAAKSGYSETTEYLVHQGADLNARDFRAQTVLAAISENHLRNWDWNFIQIYLDNGGDTFAVDALTGATVLHFAAASNSVQL